MKCMGFQIIFNISKIKQTLQIEWPNTFLPTTWERERERERERFSRNVFDRIIKATMVHHLTRKKAHIDGLTFFENPYY